MSVPDSILVDIGTDWNGTKAVSVDSERLVYERAKRVFDFVAAFCIVLSLAPLIVIVALYLLTQGGPLLIRHQRIGKRGKPFACLKFRSMVVDGDAVLERHLARDAAARAEWASNRKLKEDPRVTPFGKIMRQTSVDELPQLLNVLRGEMSLVGPRPIVAAEVVHYGIHIGQYEHVRPGLTGAWQVSGRSQLSYEARVALDCEYVARRSFRRDLSILLATVPAVLTSKGSY